jgi:hypothetical protein
MSVGDKCRECGAVIAVDSSGGLCGKCLFALGLGPLQTTPTPPPQTVPSEDEVDEEVRYLIAVLGT